MNKQYATSVLTDIRNFTGIFKKFQYLNSDEFLIFLEKYYKIQSDLAKSISNNIHMGTTGDGVLTIFLSDNHYFGGYSFLLALEKGLNKLCDEFNVNTGESVSFGIGADSGDIWKVGKKNLQTYVGTVINRSARIEANTKDFYNTQVSIGYHLYSKLIKNLYPSAYEIMEKHNGNYDALLINHTDIVMVGKELMLFFIFEMYLKNIDKPLPIFRLSGSMTKNDITYWNTMDKVSNNNTIKKIKKILNKI